MTVSATEPLAQQPPAQNDLVAVAQLQQELRQVVEQLRHVIVGLDDVIGQLLVALLCRGHVILEGVPGLAKTLIVSSVSQLLGLSFRRIQFTPDLMPADITGSDVLMQDKTTGERSFRFVNGPIFAHIILADEINRTPPKTQSALLEAMQERHVTVGNQTYPLPEPFFVLATQNPIEQEGTYPLPEAQLDRFMMKIKVDYPTAVQEIEIVKRATTEYATTLKPVLTPAAIQRMHALVKRVPVADHVYAMAVRLVRSTRPHSPETAEGVADMLNWGAGPRASISLIMASKARALLHGRMHATTQDVAAMALPVLRHRVFLSFRAESSGKSADDIVTQLIRRPENEAVIST